MNALVEQRRDAGEAISLLRFDAPYASLDESLVAPFVNDTHTQPDAEARIDSRARRLIEALVRQFLAIW
ncbi:MAG: hypothetical protein WB760_26755 [Xanthobacteraceae bacterium]